MPKFMNLYTFLKMSPDPAPAGGGDPNPAPNPAPAPAGDLAAQLAALKAENEALKSAAKPPPKPDDADLAEKARKDREAKETAASDSKKLENALRFDLTSAEWLKTNASLLPKSIEGVFAQAAKENYGSAIEKVAAMKTAIVSEFFAVQANLVQLTESQKISVAEFKALTKNDKQDRVAQIYDSIFEPTFEGLKRLEKAKQVSLGLADPNNAEASYTKRMIELSKKKNLKEKI
jgi:hypothetical protein